MTRTRESYPENVATTQCHARPPRQLRFFRIFAVVAVISTASSFLWRALYQTGSFVLVTAGWGALVTFAVVSYVRFTRRERQCRSEPDSTSEPGALQ